MHNSNGNDEINDLFDQNNLAKDHILNKLLRTVVEEVKLYAENQIKYMKKQAKIGLALSMEKDINKLLEMIVDAARGMSNADAGTLYIMSKDKKRLSFRILQNETLKTRMKGVKNFENVPEYASAHHEKIDGSGYPRGLTSEQMPLQSKLMAIADIFEALTAEDRPYKKSMKLSEALNIMAIMKQKRHIDPDIYDLFINSRVYYEYAVKEMKKEQIDMHGE